RASWVCPSMQYGHWVVWATATAISCFVRSDSVPALNTSRSNVSQAWWIPGAACSRRWATSCALGRFPDSPIELSCLSVHATVWAYPHRRRAESRRRRTVGPVEVHARDGRGRSAFVDLDAAAFGLGGFRQRHGENTLAEACRHVVGVGVPGQPDTVVERAGAARVLAHGTGTFGFRCLAVDFQLPVVEFHREVVAPDARELGVHHVVVLGFLQVRGRCPPGTQFGPGPFQPPAERVEPVLHGELGGLMPTAPTSRKSHRRLLKSRIAYRLGLQSSHCRRCPTRPRCTTDTVRSGSRAGLCHRHHLDRFSPVSVVRTATSPSRP